MESALPMSDSANRENTTIATPGKMGVGGAVARALHHHRVSAGLAIRELAQDSGVSGAMISRIENAQVSPSLSTLEALASALSVPVIAFFQHTIGTAERPIIFRNLRMWDSQAQALVKVTESNYLDFFEPLVFAHVVFQ